MALISILNSTDPLLRSRFVNAPFIHGKVFPSVEGELDGIAYRMAGPEHIRRNSGSTGRIIWLIEGGVVVQPEKLNMLIHSLNNEWPSCINEYKKFYHKAESLIQGEFVLAVISKSPERILVLNDCFGRLPLYIGKEKDSIMITRQLFHLHQTLQVMPPDNHARAFYLMMGYPPNDTTLWSNVKRVMPGSIISINQKMLTIEPVADTFRVNPDKQINTRDAVEMVTTLLDKVVQNETAGKTILSMSGGLDSRLLAGVLHKNRIPFRMISYDDADSSAANDLIIARQIAVALKLPLDVIALNHPEGSDFKDLHFLKLGMNYDGMAFILPYLRQLPVEASILTGDGGDKLLAPLNNIPPLYNIHQLARYILRHHAIMSPVLAATLTNTRPEIIMKQFESLLHSIFRTNLQQTYADFLLRQRAFKWLFEGEDRNRWFVNHQAPLWSKELAALLLQMPHSLKADYKLYRDVLLHYNHSLARIPNANWNMSVTNTRSIHMLLLRQRFKHSQLLHPIVYLIQKSVLQNTSNLPAYMSNWYNNLNDDIRALYMAKKLTTQNLYYIHSLEDKK